MRLFPYSGRTAAALFLAAVCAAPLPAQTRSAADTYVAYLTTIASMRTTAELKPFLPKKTGDMMARLPKDLEAQMIQQGRKEMTAGVRVVRETKVGGATIVEVEGIRSGKPVKGWAKMIVEDGEFKVGKDDWSGRLAPAAPKIPPSVSGNGKATGELTVNGQTAKLQRAVARAVPSSDPAKVSYEVTLSDAPWSPSDSTVDGRVRAGTLHFVQLTLSPDKHVVGAALHHRALENGVLPAAGGEPLFEAERFGPDVVSGRAYLEIPVDGADLTYYYAATFKAAVENPASDRK